MSVLILLCGHCGVPESAGSASFDTDVEARWSANLCHAAEEALRGTRSVEDLLTVGPDLEGQILVLEAAIRSGVDPLRIRFLDVWRVGKDAGDLIVHIRGALARMRATGGVKDSPRRSARTFRGALPRRSLLLPTVRYWAPLPRVDASRCVADAGCDLCVRACPASAIAGGNPPRIAPELCHGCSVCLAACPVAAVGHPALDFKGVEAEAGVLADGPRRTLLVACTATLVSLDSNELAAAPGPWRLLEVPSLGSLRSEQVLRLLAQGFDRIVAVGRGPCCPEGQAPFEVARVLLANLGVPDRILFWNVQVGPVASDWAKALPSGGRPLPAVRSIHELALALAGSGGSAIDLPGRGAGLVTVEPDLCTFCELCAERCPTAALRIEDGDGGAVRITFDHELCDACGLCSPVCPEGALRVRSAVDPAAVGRRDRLAEDTWVCCRSCGRKVAPAAMIAVVAARLSSPAGLDLCPDCKPLRLVPSR